MDSDSEQEKIAVGISSCLLGERVRFDGGHKNNAYIVQTLGDYFEFTPFCPEMAIGLGVPRTPVHLIRAAGEIRCVDNKNPDLDVTTPLRECADHQRHWHRQICGYILKKDSPSCGMERVKVYSSSHTGANPGPPRRDGSGIYAARLMANFPYLPVEEEGRLGDASLRENFIQRVFIYQRWQHLVAQGLTWDRLNRFHASHKLILMSHNQSLNRDLGRLLAQSSALDVTAFSNTYLEKLTAILKIVATRKNHVNVLQHIQGYLKRQLDKDDIRELTDTIHAYRDGLLPLIVPITLLRHHFRRNPSPYIEQSWYMHPHPRELMLLNHL